MKPPKIWDFLCHTNIVLGIMFFIFFWLDRRNPAMAFISSNISKWLLLVFSLCAIVNGVIGARYLFLKKKLRTLKVLREHKMSN